MKGGNCKKPETNRKIINGKMLSLRCFLFPVTFNKICIENVTFSVLLYQESNGGEHAR
jgi:hypothetical protein